MQTNSISRYLIPAAILSAFIVAPSIGNANCRIHVETGKCVFVAQSERTAPEFSVGDDFPIYDHSMVIDIDRLGLPPVDGSWRYYKTGTDVYRVDAQSFKVLAVIRNVRR